LNKKQKSKKFEDTLGQNGIKNNPKKLSRLVEEKTK